LWDLPQQFVLLGVEKVFLPFSLSLDAMTYYEEDSTLADPNFDLKVLDSTTNHH